MALKLKKGFVRQIPPHLDPLVKTLREQAARMQLRTMSQDDCLEAARMFRLSAMHWRNAGRDAAAAEAASIARGFETASRQRRAQV